MDMSKFTAPKSDQLNADDLIAGPMTVRIERVSATGSADQPVAVHLEGASGRPFKPCKSMRRVMIAAWGVDASQYVGRSMTLYRDPKVVFGGMEVGGIRISAMSHIASPLALSLTVTKAKRAPYRVLPLAEEPPASKTGAGGNAASSGGHPPAADHVGSEPALPPLPEPQLLSPEGEVLTADQPGIARFKELWLAHLDRIDIEQSVALADAERAIAVAKELLAAKPKMVAWLESLAMQCRAKVATPQ